MLKLVKKLIAILKSLKRLWCTRCCGESSSSSALYINLICFAKPFIPKQRLESQRGLRVEIKDVVDPNGTSLSFSCTVAHAIHFLHFLSRGENKHSQFRDIWWKVWNPSLCKEFESFVIFFILIYCVPSCSFFVSLSQKTNLFVALPSQSKKRVVANQFLLPKIFLQFLFPKIFCLCVSMCQ